MTLCVEALISPEGGDFSIKLEDQVLITETGCENLTKYPFDPRLLGHGPRANPGRNVRPSVRLRPWAGRRQGRSTR